MVGVISFILTSVFVVKNYSDLLVCIEGACIWGTGVIMTITLAVCLVFRKDFRSFLEEMAFKDVMLEMPFVKYVLTLDQGYKLKELKIMVLESQENLLKYCRVLMRIYSICVWISASLYIINAIYQMVIREDNSLRLLAFDMWFPWSLDDINIYIVSFIFHAYCGYMCCVAYPGLQMTICFLMGQIIRQLKILTFILQHLDELALEINGQRDSTWQIHCTTIMCQCVDHYVKIKRFGSRLNVYCQPFYLVLILASTLILCLCSVKIAVSEKFTLDTMKYYVHGFCVIMFVLMFCSLGQKIDNECDTLENAVMEKWYIFNKEHKTIVRIFKMALSQRMPVYVFGTIPLSLPTFTWFIKTGMSFFTLMMSVLEEQ
uniref:Odorant receptor n=1 Tax=Dendrolimus punctatus TaxID=238572 RepID=A0A2K8GKW7_9NEOP|nr:Odorant Receptor 50 [Dendrolimus punctatus]